nr:right-handed parallel beta-helix repeat-containing protein [uncultured Chryseobacterium sp.]
MKNLYKLLITSTIAVASFNTLQATVRYVNISNIAGSAPYTSWATAGNDLQAVINESVAGDEIWIASGTYIPNSLPTGAVGTTLGGATVLNTRDYTFFVKDGVKMYGGFSGAETLFNQRNPMINKTILSGDLGTIGSKADNCYHVVIASDGTLGVTIDGFSITGGNADSSSGGMEVNGKSIYRWYGGGIYACYGKSSITNNIFYDNEAGNNGAGLYSMNNSSIIISSNTFYSNNALGGGAIYSYTNTSITISDNIIRNNTASTGGGLATYYSTNIISGNKIYDNKVWGEGGGIYVTSGTSTINNNWVHHNITDHNGGGGIYLNYGNNTIFNNAIYENKAFGVGGGILLSGNNILTNNIIFKNGASSYGGGIYMSNGTHTITNNTIYSNSVNINREGGGIFTTSGSGTLKNNIFWDNKKGGANNTVSSDFYNSNNSAQVNFSNNLLQLQSALYTIGNFNFLGSNAQGNLFGQNPGFGNVVNPLGADGIPLTEDDGLALVNNSICRAAGTISGAPVTDCTGATRTGIPNLGAYEVIFPLVLGVSDTTTDKNALKVYPNPAKDYIYFSEKVSDITIYTIDGKYINASFTKGKVNISHLSQGLYIITAKDDKGNILSQRFIKE